MREQGQDLLNTGFHLGLNRLIHQGLRGAPYEVPTFTQNIYRHRNSDNGI